MDGLLGRKVGMTRVFDGSGNAVPVTVLEAGPCSVVQIKTKDRDGYEAVQLGFGQKKEKRTTKPLNGHFKTAGVAPTAVLHEFRINEIGELAPGSEVLVDIFTPGDRADVTAKTKGKGFTGVVKAYGFHGASRASHGGSSYKRAPGSLGQSASPSRVFKGKRLPRRIGGTKKTVLNLEVVQVVPERNLLLVRGAVPGPNGGNVIVKKSKRNVKSYAL